MPALVTTTTPAADKNGWRTPPALFDLLNRRYAFTVDAAADERNHLLPRYWTAETNGLRTWRGERVFVNPPYGAGPFAYPAWLRHADQQAAFHYDVPLAALLVPFDPSTHVWREYVDGRATDVLMLAGRVRFLRPDGTPQKAANFPSAVVIYQGRQRGPTAYRHWDWKYDALIIEQETLRDAG